MYELILILTTWLIAYLIGSISISYYWLKLSKQIDLRQVGSGSIGARNTSRYLGKKGFVLTLFFDIFKGGLAVFIASSVLENPAYIYPSAIFVTAGHIWPVLLGFKGGKGIATSLGAFAMIDIRIVFALGIIFIFFYILLRRFTRSGLISYCLLPVTLLVLKIDTLIIFFITLCSLIVLWAHKENIKEDLNILKENKNE